MATETTTRQRRGVAVQSAVLDVTLELIGEHGYGFSIDDVADRAEVHKTTVYRNWATKPALIAAAIERLADTNITTSRTDDPIADLVALTVAVAKTLRIPTGAQAIRAIVAAAADDSDLVDTARRFLTARYEIAATIIDHAIEQGLLRRDIDSDLMWRSIVNPLHMAAIVGAPASDATARTIIDNILRGAMP